ncbi:MAG: hypothetical protein AAB224_03785 [Gemmatimonadota bacterium]
MNINYVHLCDYALLSTEQKPSMMGLFSKIAVATFPTVHPQAYLVFEIALDYTEVGMPIDVRVEIVDIDGKKLMQANARIPTRGEGKPGDTPTIPQILRLPPLQFPKAGRYDINIFLGADKGAKAHLPFEVVQMTPPPAEAPKE